MEKYMISGLSLQFVMWDHNFHWFAHENELHGNIFHIYYMQNECKVILKNCQNIGK